MSEKLNYVPYFYYCLGRNAKKPQQAAIHGCLLRSDYKTKMSIKITHLEVCTVAFDQSFNIHERLLFLAHQIKGIHSPQKFSLRPYSVLSMGYLKGYCVFHYETAPLHIYKTTIQQM